MKRRADPHKTVENIEKIRGCEHVGLFYICGMETPMLVIQDPADANESIARRINIIYSKFDGGLGEFFERLQRERSERESASASCETNRLIGVRLKAVVARGNQSECGND